MSALVVAFAVGYHPMGERCHPVSVPRIGVYPGSFNPPTTAHLAIAAAAKEQRRLERVHLVHSRRALGKGEVERPLFEHRVAVLETVAAEHDWLEATVTEAQLLVDVAHGYDVVIMGADKWHQIQELGWYDDADHRDASMALLPEVAVAPRRPLHVPAEIGLALPTHVIDGISSTDARAGRLDLMADAARRFAERTGAWIDDDRYDRFVTETR